MACKGYLSASEAWRASLRFDRAMKRGKKPVLIHLGDHDPSGLDMTRDNGVRLREFLSMGVDVRRVALNMDQVETYNPPPNPAKETDSRFEGYMEQFGSESWELDALRQNTIGDIITSALEEFIDPDRWEESMQTQAERRVPLAALPGRWDEVEELVLSAGRPLDQLRQLMDATDGVPEDLALAQDTLAPMILNVGDVIEAKGPTLRARLGTHARNIEMAREPHEGDDDA